MSTEAMKLALEALEPVSTFGRVGSRDVDTAKAQEAITALREALAQPQQEPVAWMHEWEDGEKIPMLKGRDDRNQDKPKTVRPLVYGDTSPQPAQPQQEPVAWMHTNAIGHVYFRKNPQDKTLNPVPLYTSPPAQPLPFGVGGGLVAIKTLLSRDPCAHASTAIQMIDAILAEQPAQPHRKPLTSAEIRKWWASENGFEDCNMAKLDDFEQVVRAVEGKHGIKENT